MLAGRAPASMAKARHLILLDKAMNACLAAVEIYNKPRIAYREETFAILMLNAWELLLKAHVVQRNHGDHRSIEVTEFVRKKDGTQGKRKRRKLSRSGSPITIGLQHAINLTRNYDSRSSIDDACVANLELLTEIRDNAIHFYNVEFEFAKRIHAVGTASLMNFATAANEWFDKDVTDYSFHILPVAFQPPDTANLLGRSRQVAVKGLLEHIASQERSPSFQGGMYEVTVPVELRFVRSRARDAVPVRVVTDNDRAVPVAIKEDDVWQQYSWDYKVLTDELRARYSDFVQNQRYHDIRKQIEKSGKHHRVRYLDPRKKVGTRKALYHPGILTEFDNHYTKR